MTKKDSDIALASDNSLAELGIDVEQMQKDAQHDGDIGIGDISIPYLYILQTNSPQVNEDSEKYIEGAKAGMYFLSVVEKVFDGREKGVELIFCYYNRNLNEWVPRDDGGGLVAVYDMDDPIKNTTQPDEKGRPILPNGNLLVDTANHFCLLYDPETKAWTQCIFPMKSTALKVSRKLNSLVKTTYIPGTDVRAPRYLYKHRATTVKEQKDTNIWSSPKLEMGGMVNKPEYNAAKEYAIVAEKGILRQAGTESAEAESEDNAEAVM
ncbi:MAG: hypothetical protein ACXADB_10665 [Candidatus Hermodarchaeia archaeon]|jgi:hypothetical protein